MVTTDTHRQSKEKRTTVMTVEQLNTLDAGFLMAEDSDRNVSLAIGGIAIIDGAAPKYGQIQSCSGGRVRSIPRFTQMLRTQFFDVGAPQWIDDPSFDISRHVRRIAVPRPGDDTELFRVVADVLERRLDRDRPLWKCWVIEGLKNNRWAILMKVHHCMADGISAMPSLPACATKATAMCSPDPSPSGQAGTRT